MQNHYIILKRRVGQRNAAVKALADAVKQGKVPLLVISQQDKDLYHSLLKPHLDFEIEFEEVWSHRTKDIHGRLYDSMTPQKFVGYKIKKKNATENR